MPKNQAAGQQQHLAAGRRRCLGVRVKPLGWFAAGRECQGPSVGAAVYSLVPLAVGIRPLTHFLLRDLTVEVKRPAKVGPLPLLLTVRPKAALWPVLRRAKLLLLLLPPTLAAAAEGSAEEERIWLPAALAACRLPSRATRGRGGSMMVRVEPAERTSWELELGRCSVRETS